jgi:hypothetical protein
VNSVGWILLGEFCRLDSVGWILLGEFCRLDSVGWILSVGFCWVNVSWIIEQGEFALSHGDIAQIHPRLARG